MHASFFCHILAVMGVGMCYELVVYIILNIYLVIEWSCCLVDDGKVSTCTKRN
jgi:hypothetical protein